MPEAPTNPRRTPSPTQLEQFRAALWRYAVVLGADDATADDLTQDAMLVLLQRQDFEAKDAAATFTFLRTTVRHRWLKHVRRSVTHREVEHADEVWREECGDGAGDDYVAALRACIDELPARSQALLQHTYQHDLGRAGTARLFGISEQGIKSSLRRLRRALRGCIERRRRRAT